MTVRLRPDIGVKASIGSSKSESQSSETIISGGDTNIIGSQVSGKQVTADVGGNLSIASVQDVTSSAAHQSSAGGGFESKTIGGAPKTMFKPSAGMDYWNRQ